MSTKTRATIDRKFIQRRTPVLPGKQSREPVTLRRGEMTDAAPAVSGWRMAVDELFG
jgi:hypothetical protein